MSATSIYRDAVVDDGRDVLYEVTTRLYEGDNLRPDIYFQTNPRLRHKNYNQIFNCQQRNLIENSGLPEYYDIDEGARHFDISLHSLLAEHMCGLAHSDLLYKKVMKLKTIRNEVCHGSEITQLHLELQELLNLYRDILKALEQWTGDDLMLVVVKIERKINARMQSERTYNSWDASADEDWSYGSSLLGLLNPRPDNTYHTPSTSTSVTGYEIPTWGKVAIGVAGAAMSIYEAMTATPEKGETERKRDETKRNQPSSDNNKEECVVM